jgi:eukaryotic-like serine/threonine-protein kinase
MGTHPRRLGKYELQARLGRGGMAEVWKALDTQLQRYVAIKMLQANLKEDPQFIARFEHEARLIASLHHPNIVQIHDFQIASVEEEGTVAYMVMDYVEGQTLADYIRHTSARGTFPSAVEIVQLFTSIGLAVDYAHQRGMIHRDLKPANILLDGRNTLRNPMGEPILTDFGLARLLAAHSAATTAVQLGTPLYISPEQVTGYAGNERSDIYALGIILYEIVTGTLPFQGDSPSVVMYQHLHTPPPSPALINPNVPPALVMVIMRCLAKEPELRLPKASSLAAAIAEAMNVAVPESLGEPTYPVNAEYMPTYLVPGSVHLTPGKSLSAPMLSAGQTPAPARLRVDSSPVQAPAGNRDGFGASTPAQASPQSASSTPAQAHATPRVQAPPAAPPAFAPAAPSRSRPHRGLLLGLVAALVIILLAGSLGTYFLLLRSGALTSAPAQLAGQAFYVSSGQLGEGAQGIADQLQLEMQNVQPPPAGKSYYLWLLGDATTLATPDLLGPAPVRPPILLTNDLVVQSNRSVHYAYPGDSQHNNLLSATSRLLITLENAGNHPASPSTNRASWMYYAQLPQQLIPHDPTGLRGLDHIRHLYYNEDHLRVLGLYGGLDVWVLRNTAKLMELSTSARDDFDPTGSHYGLMHNLFTSILDYLDGTPNVHLDVPPGTAVTADSAIARVGLLTVDSTHQGGTFSATDPPGDLDHMRLHLTQLNRAPDATAQMHTLSQSIIGALNNASGWLQQVRVDTRQLFDMTPAQLSQPAARALLDDLVTRVTYAYIGQLDPATDTVRPGVLQAHYDVQKLAAFDITKNVPQRL